MRLPRRDRGKTRRLTRLPKQSRLPRATRGSLPAAAYRVSDGRLALVQRRDPSAPRKSVAGPGIHRLTSIHVGAWSWPSAEVFPPIHAGFFQSLGEHRVSSKGLFESPGHAPHAGGNNPEGVNALCPTIWRKEPSTLGRATFRRHRVLQAGSVRPSSRFRVVDIVIGRYTESPSLPPVRQGTNSWRGDQALLIEL